ncbi:hypothetical protein Pst134EA_024358 [Puccinia striiformis f. sp. tritici]|uniref:hypothetical protein n=1 Tax=Puccinia striiformis f. sp. tritici TaxID=168172 RepID=UPI002008444E|nr:hypothetical protein Pst134EA_024358 [Puccinia striiformis f. sp. tritici]KAH9453487.1 hypothetical protein Pst134EA_024358 [Puccinia striiformis f. sp. tritici]KAI9614517.1 hypothetical protein KEM48_005983 [Puccinia striiformis f. sp. tritici PST-130]
MFKKPASFGLFLAVFLQVASGSFALSTAGSPQVGISHQQPIVSSSASTVIQQWSEVHTKFSQGQNVFNSGASVGVAIRSVQTLYHSCQTVSNQYSICDSCADAASSQVTALQCYASVWKSQFASVFQQFSIWVTATKTACSSLNPQLDVILKGLNLNLNLFLVSTSTYQVSLASLAVK